MIGVPPHRHGCQFVGTWYFRKSKRTDLRIDKQKRCNFGRQKINNSRQETGFIFVIQVKDVFIQEIQVSRSYLLSRCCGFCDNFKLEEFLTLTRKIIFALHIKESTKMSGFFIK